MNKSESIANLAKSLALVQASLAPARRDDATVDATPEQQPAGGEDLNELLLRYQGNRNAVARHLGISRTTLWRRLNNANGRS